MAACGQWRLTSFVARVHVHDRGSKLPAPLRPEQLEERAHDLTASTAADPQHPLARGLDDDGGVAMPFLDGELVHANDLQPIEINGAEFTLQAGKVQILDGLPVQTEEAGHVPDRGHTAQLCHRLAQPARHPRVGLQPAQPLQLGATA
jgi:hypothetical protein